MKIKQINYQEYEEFLNSLDLISCSRQWADFLKLQFGAEPYYFGIFESDQLRYIIPGFEMENKFESVPKLYTEIIPYRHNIKFNDISLFEEFKNLNFDSIKLALVSILYPENEQTYQNFMSQKGVAHILNIKNESEESILKNKVAHKTRNQILGAYKDNIFFLKEISADQFYESYLKTIARLHSIPKEKEFFTNLEKSFGNSFRILAAYAGDEIAGANVVLIKNKYLHLPFNVSESKYFKNNINNFLYWETIKFGLKNGIEIFDFGPSVLSDSSHHHFKEGFGAVSLPIYSWSYYNSRLEHIRDIASKKLRNLRLRLKKL